MYQKGTLGKRSETLGVLNQKGSWTKACLDSRLLGTKSVELIDYYTEKITVKMEEKMSSKQVVVKRYIWNRLISIKGIGFKLYPGIKRLTQCVTQL